MSPSLIITAYCLLFLQMFSLALFLFIVLRRVVLQYQEKKFERLSKSIEKDILEALSAAGPELSLQVAGKYKSQPAALTKVLLAYGYILTGEGKDRLRIIFNQVLKEKCLRDLSSPRTIKRLKSARLFIVFFDPAESAFLLKLLHDKPMVKLTAITTLSRIPSPDTLCFIFKAFEEDTGYAVRSYFNIIFGLGQRVEPLIKEYLKKPLSAEKLGLLIELVGAIPLPPLYEDIIVFSHHPDKEIRIKVARALGKLLVPDSAGFLITLTQDEAWEVKAQAVKSLGKLKNPETLDILAQSLFSPFWYVRYNAGYGLASMGGAGLKKLREVAAQKQDRYASEMSIMVLNDLIYLEEAA